MCQFQSNEPAQVFLLADRQHLPNPAADPEEAEATLTVRDLPNSPATPIDRSQWSFVRVEDEDVEPRHSHIYMPSGFEPGRIYQLVYTTAGSRIVGLGFVAMRDVVSFLKHAPSGAGNPIAGAIDYAYAIGRSQSGRFLRQYIHTGVNDDENDRPALDGIIPHVAGGMRGEFNMRFGQPSKDVCYIIPEMFPFTDTPADRSGDWRARVAAGSHGTAGQRAQGDVHQYVGRVLARRRRPDTHRPRDPDRRARIGVSAPLSLRWLPARVGGLPSAGVPRQ